MLFDACEVSKKNTKVSATQCKDAALVYNTSQIKQVFEVGKATAGKEKEASWQLAVERRSKLVLL